MRATKEVSRVRMAGGTEKGLQAEIVGLAWLLQFNSRALR